MSSLSDRLKHLRNKKDKTQKQMADFLGLKNERTYRQYEAGEIDLSTSKLIQLANYFEVSTDYLLGRTDNPKTIEHDIEAVQYATELMEKLSPLLLEKAVELKNIRESRELELTDSKLLAEYKSKISILSED